MLQIDMYKTMAGGLCMSIARSKACRNMECAFCPLDKEADMTPDECRKAIDTAKEQFNIEFTIDPKGG